MPLPPPAAAIPAVDLRLLSSTDLHSLAAVRSHVIAPATDPEIDRSAFNESAASRKQTYSRFRLRRPSKPDPIPRRRPDKPLADYKSDSVGDAERKIVADRLLCLFKPQTLAHSASPSCHGDIPKDEIPDRSGNPSGGDLEKIVDSSIFDTETQVETENPNSDREILAQFVSPGCDDEEVKSVTLDRSENPRCANLETLENSSIENPIHDLETFQELKNPIHDPESLAESEKPNDDLAELEKPDDDPKTLAESENPDNDPETLAENPDNSLEAVAEPLKEKDMGEEDRDRDRGVLNRRGEEVDLVGLGEKGDFYNEELRRRTVGFLSEEQLVRFMGEFEGEWGSCRKKTRIVDATEFGDCLPVGWKLLLCIKRKNNDMWVYCKKYISPSQKKFASCKEVSSYVLSLNGQLNIARSTFVDTDGSIPDSTIIVPHDVAGSLAPTRDISEMQSCYIGEPSSPLSAIHHEQVQKVESLSAEKATDIPRCLDCNLNFSDNDAYQQHQCSNHQSTKRRKFGGKLVSENDSHQQHLCSNHQSTKRRKRGGKLVDGVIIRDGKFECQFCHKSFTERHRYVGHVGSHVRPKVQTNESISEKKSSRKKCYHILASPVPYIDSSMSISPEGMGNLAVNSADKPHITSPTSIIDSQFHAVGFDSQYRVADHTDFAYSSQFDNDNGNFDFNISRCIDIIESSNGRNEESFALLDASGSTNFSIVTREDFTNRTDAQHSQSCVTNFIVKDVTNSTIQCIKPDVGKDDEFLHLNATKQESGLEDSKAIDNPYFNMAYISNVDLAKINNDAADGMCQASSMSISFGENNANADGFVSELEADVNDAFSMETSACFDSISMSLYNSNSYENDIEKNVSSFSSVSDIKGYSGEHISLDGKVYVPIGSSGETNCFSSESFLGRGTVTSSTTFDQPNGNSSNIPFINGNSSGIWTNTGSMLDFVADKSILEGADRRNGLDNCLNMNGVGYEKLGASDSAHHNNGRTAQQQTENLTSVCPKQEKISCFERLKTDASESPGYVSLNGQGMIPVLQPPAESYFTSDFENVDHISHQLNWDLSLPNSSNHQLNLVCVWCDCQFSHENSGGTENSDSLGFLCPTCKAKISGYINDIGEG